MIRISIVVPLLRQSSPDRDLAAFEDTLASVLRHRPDHAQIVVVHNGSYDDPHGLGCEIEWVVSDDSRSACLMSAAVNHCRGDLVTWVQPGVELDEGWEQPVVPEFDDECLGCISGVLVTSTRPSRIVTAGIQIDSGGTRRMVGHHAKLTPRSIRRLSPIGPVGNLAVYRRTILEVVAGQLAECQNDYLDVELALANRRLGFTTRLCPEWIGSVDEESLITNSFGIAHGCEAERSLARYGDRPVTLMSTFARSCWDLASAVISPWRALHGLQRLSAVRFRRADVQYGQQLASSRFESVDDRVKRELVRRAA